MNSYEVVREDRHIMYGGAYFGEEECTVMNSKILKRFHRKEDASKYISGLKVRSDMYGESLNSYGKLVRDITDNSSFSRYIKYSEDDEFSLSDRYMINLFIRETD